MTIWLVATISSMHETHLFFMGLTQYPVDHEMLCYLHVGRHVDISLLQFFLGPSNLEASSVDWIWTALASRPIT